MGKIEIEVARSPVCGQTAEADGEASYFSALCLRTSDHSNTGVTLCPWILVYDHSNTAVTLWVRTSDHSNTAPQNMYLRYLRCSNTKLRRCRVQIAANAAAISEEATAVRTRRSCHQLQYFYGAEGAPQNAACSCMFSLPYQYADITPTIQRSAADLAAIKHKSTLDFWVSFLWICTHLHLPITRERKLKVALFLFYDTKCMWYFCPEDGSNKQHGITSQTTAVFNTHCCAHIKSSLYSSWWMSKSHIYIFYC
jgi:hypothetical protein